MHLIFFLISNCRLDNVGRSKLGLGNEIDERISTKQE